MTIGEAIRAEREERGLTWFDLEAALDMGDIGTFMGAIEDTAKHGPPSVDLLLRLRRIGLDPLGRIVREEEGAPRPGRCLEGGPEGASKIPDAPGWWWRKEWMQEPPRPVLVEDPGDAAGGGLWTRCGRYDVRVSTLSGWLGPCLPPECPGLGALERQQ